MSCKGVGVKLVRPILSLSHHEAHLRVLALYRAYYRYIPELVSHFDMPKNEIDVRNKIREYFYRNSHVSDIRVIDLLIMKGYMELKEMKNCWAQKCHTFAHWCPTYECKPADFVSKFIENPDEYF